MPSHGKSLSPELKNLVSQAVALLGKVIQRELGPKSFQRIEKIRQEMTHLRNESSVPSFQRLQKLYTELEKLTPSEQYELAHSFTLMLELMNACENAYRSHQLSTKHSVTDQNEKGPDRITYVLTAHPTEARSPQNIAIFHAIQNQLQAILTYHTIKQDEAALKNLLEIAWHTSIVRNRTPRVRDEAEHIYSLLFRDDILLGILHANIPLQVRTWVGGDKDGHPGVDQKALLQSLTLSRQSIINVSLELFKQVRADLELFDSGVLLKNLSQLDKSIRRLRTLKTGDGKRILILRQQLEAYIQNYQKILGSQPTALSQLQKFWNIFPGLVVPLELRESSDVLMLKLAPHQTTIIDRMLSTVERISRGGQPNWYARSLIVSMTQSLAHLQAAARKQIKIFGHIPLPIVPLFEESSSLQDSENIMQSFIHDRKLLHAAKQNWNSQLEMMVGYSDSSKEAGVFPSRLVISQALIRLEKIVLKAKLTPIFFHGSGGSIDRGGGSVEDQTAWWPRSALRRYKVTIQGEMIERSFANAAIAERQLQTVINSAAHGLHKKCQQAHSKELSVFAERISQAYRAQIKAPNFLKMVETATPYSYLRFLKIGSRPNKRSSQLQVQALRAIPWILCWTQSRVLFPTWWGVGSAWEQSSTDEKNSLKKAFQNTPVFTSYIKALGFTLAKVELEVWNLYLEKSQLPVDIVKEFQACFADEYKKSVICYQALCGHKNLMWYRPWLGESIRLRSSMIHPLNLLQILAQKNKDPHLLRVTVTGISSGMMTTG